MTKHRLLVQFDAESSSSLACEAAAFIAGMIAATFGPSDYYPPDGDGAPIHVTAYGAEPPTEQLLDHWSRIASASLPRILSTTESPVVITLQAASGSAAA